MTDARAKSDVGGVDAHGDGGRVVLHAGGKEMDAQAFHAHAQLPQRQRQQQGGASPGYPHSLLRTWSIRESADPPQHVRAHDRAYAGEGVHGSEHDHWQRQQLLR